MLNKSAFVNLPGYSKQLFLLIIIIVATTWPQQTAAQIMKASSKLSPLLERYLGEALPDSLLKLRITFSGPDLPKQISKSTFKVVKAGSLGNYAFYNVTATYAQLVSEILPLNNVLFIEDGLRKPKEELLIENLDLSTNKINVVHQYFPAWNGNGTTVSIKENKFDTSDIDLAGRVLTTSVSSPIYSSHASIMATMIGGAGNTWYQGKGAAWGSTISSSDFASLLPDTDSVYRKYNISVQNHSYGVGIENFYGTDAAAFDISSINNGSLLHVFSSGNSGLSTAGSGTYANTPGFANLTGSFKMAKNIITVGATDSFGVTAALSSKGPAYDGRVKPDLVAFGIDGSSGSAALVSGVSLLLQQGYKQLNGSWPPNALIKSILINSADDVGNKEVDYVNGFGTLNAAAAVKTLQSGRYMSGSVAAGETKNFNISIPANLKQVKLTLTWSDPAALPNAVKALVNDLDIELVNTITRQTWMPWVLNASPSFLQQPAARSRDSINNVEQITLEKPAAGMYQFNVKGYSLTGTQVFFVTWQFDTSNVFEWQFPLARDIVLPSSTNILRWNSSLPDSVGKLDYSTDEGVNWTFVSDVTLTKGYFKWNTPSIIGAAILRMTVRTTSFLSDTLVITPRTILGVGFNCPDSFLYHWTKLPGVNDYRIYRLGDLYLEPLFVTNDSFMVLTKAASPSVHYAVAPVIAGREGVKSYTVNYTNQGVQCYFRSFLASLNNNAADLRLEFGSLYNVKRIVLEKLFATGYKEIQQAMPSGLQLSFTDNTVFSGVNTYRIKLEFTSGGAVYSQRESVNYFAASRNLIFPNPVAQNQSLQILIKDVDRAMLQIFDAKGLKVYQKTVDDTVVSIPAGFFGKGLYIVQITNNGSRETRKVVVY